MFIPPVNVDRRRKSEERASSVFGSVTADVLVNVRRPTIVGPIKAKSSEEARERLSLTASVISLPATIEVGLFIRLVSPLRLHG
jgi:hypothetical protein